MTPLLRLVALRLAWMLLVLAGVSLLAFLLIHAVPGNPWQKSGTGRAMVNISLDATSMRELDRQFGLDKPLWAQYTTYLFGSRNADGRFICGAICGNLGPSFRYRGIKVTDVLFRAADGKNFWFSRVGYTLRIAGLAFLYTALVGIPLGVVMAVRNGSSVEHILSGLMTLLTAVPNFVLGILLILILASWLHILRVLPDWNDPRSWIVPVFVLAAAPTVNMARLTRTAVHEAMLGEYVRAARAKGLSRPKVVWVHVLPNALPPILSALIPVLVELVAASFIVEAVFGLPGIGREFWESVRNKDFPMIMGLTLLYSLAIVSINVVIEVFYGVLDPRLRRGGNASG
jgi:oligopeptide transport system permease protein